MWGILTVRLQFVGLRWQISAGSPRSHPFLAFDNSHLNHPNANLHLFGATRSQHFARLSGVRRVLNLRQNRLYPLLPTGAMFAK